MSTKEKILFVLMQVFFITIIFPYNDILTGFITGGMMLCCLLFNSVKEKFSLFKDRKPIIWMILFFAWNFISAVTSKNVNMAFIYIDPQLPLFYLPLTVGLIKTTKAFKEKILLSFAVITTLYCMICLAVAIEKYVVTGNVDWLYSDGITMLTGQQAIYISLVVNFSIYIFGWFIFFTASKLKAILIPGIIFLFIVSFMLASRSMMIVLYTFVLGFLLNLIFKQKKYVAGVAILIVISAAGFTVLKVFPKTLNRFEDFVYTQYDFHHDASESHYSKETTPDQWNGANFRIAAWRCGWELFKERPLAGAHLGEKKSSLMEKYKEKDFQFAIRTNKNLHNNYLDILVGTGIIGLLLFLVGWLVLPLRGAFIAADYVSVLIIITFSIAMITEVYFDREIGGMLVGFFIPLLMIDKDRS
jgi:O-antigen ligase